jgi:signal peptidase II
VAKLPANNARLLFWPTLVLVAVVVADQASKLWAVAALSDRPSLQILGNFLQFTLVYNEGGALGTQIGPASYYLIASLLILGFVLYYAWVNRGRLALSIPLALIAGGAIGNIIDRIRIGRVVDFIDVDFFNIHAFGIHLERFWTFNVADAAISCSIVFLAILMIFHPEQSHDRSERRAHAPVESSPAPQDNSSTD